MGQLWGVYGAAMGQLWGGYGAAMGPPTDGAVGPQTQTGAEVPQADVAPPVQQHIVRFDVPLRGGGASMGGSDPIHPTDPH